MAWDVSLEVPGVRGKQIRRGKIFNSWRQILRLNHKRPAEMDRNHWLITGIAQNCLEDRNAPSHHGRNGQWVLSIKRNEAFSASVHEFTWTGFTQIHQCLELAWYKLGIKETKGSYPCRNHETPHIKNSGWKESTNLRRNLTQEALLLQGKW